MKRVLEGALEHDGDARQTYLAAACGGDAALRAQVDDLLASHASAAAFLETPAGMLLDRPRPREDLSGRVVNSYRLLSQLGAGGMGEVYLAHDDKLDRQVALKFLSSDTAEDQGRLRRFHQEARAASSLNHPHILIVHDFGELDGRPYIATEFVEGETLRARLRRGAMPVGEAVAIGTQIAGALAAAHARGLVHRDIKPDNVMLRPDGYVKVLDFGLAKLAAAGSPVGPAADPTRTLPGMVVGTPQYMSPEQARGLEVDARSDLWSLGVVLYEMLAGRPPFAGPTAADAVAAILSTEPRPLELHPSCPPVSVTAIVSKALRKDRLARYADANEMLTDLRNIGSPDEETAVRGPAEGEPELPSFTAERRRATVLVSMVAEYASLIEGAAPATVEAVIDRVRAAAAETMRRHGGIVNQAIGEEIVSLFGIPATHEDDDLRAVRAAFELHAETRAIGGALAVRLQSGLHAGSVVAQRLIDGPRRYAVTGSPVQVASRLAAAAEPDAILLSPDCYRRVAPFVRAEARPPVSALTDSAPIVPHRVLGESGLESRIDAAEPGGLTPYTGRTAELNALEAQLEATRHGEGRLVLVVGGAGSGKSRILHELRARVAGAGFALLQGRCRSYGGVSSYLPFVEALHAALGMRDQDGVRPAVDQLVARIRGIDPSLEPFIPIYLHLLSAQSDDFPLPRHLRGEHLRAAMLEALAAIFTCCAHRAPTLLFLEDWHWADGGSRQALQHLMEVATAYPLLIIVTSRPEPGALPDGSDQALRLNLGPLDTPASLAIVKAVLGVERVPDDLARRLQERTGGNPFFLEEMCHALSETNVVTVSGGAAIVNGSVDALQLPDTVQAVIRSRLDRLNPEGREALRVAAVIGREFARGVLSDAMRVADLTGAIERLKNAGIIQQVRILPDPVYRFKHVLMQEVTYESLLEHQRKSLHQIVGEAMERACSGAFDPPLDLLAYHFSQAEAWDRAVDYGLRAAGRSTGLSQLADALNMLERVQSWLTRMGDEAPLRDRLADVLLRQERLCETLGLRRRQVDLSEQVIALLAREGASMRLTEAYLRQGDVFTLLKRFDAADRALATALRMSSERGDAALERSALRSIGLLRWHQGRNADALAITERALAIDRERRDDPAVAGDLSNLGTILLSMDQHHRALVVLEEALAMPAVAGDPIRQAYILHIIANVHRARGHVDRALEYLQRADDSAQAHMLPIQRSFHLTSIAHIHLQEGRLADALRLYDEAVELSRRARHAVGLAQSLRMRGEVLFGIGRDAEALAPLQEAALLFAQLEDREAELLIYQHVATLRERCAPADAVAAWERVRALALAAGEGRAELAALEGIARVTRRLAPSPADAVPRFAEALALASRLGDRRAEATLRNTIGILHWLGGAFIDALECYEAGLALGRDLGDRVHEGLTLNSIGVTLVRLQRYEEARTVLEEALTVNRETGERRLEAHTLAVLGDVAHTLERFDRARHHLEASLAIRRELKDRTGEGWMLHYLGRTSMRLGDATGAAAFAGEAARIAVECGDEALRRACAVTDGSDTPPSGRPHKE